MAIRMANSSHSACQAGSPICAFRKARSSGDQSRAIHRMGNPFLKRIAPIPYGDASVRMQTCSASTRCATEIQRATTIGVPFWSLIRPLRRSLVHATAWLIRRTNMRCVGLFFIETFGFLAAEVAEVEATWSVMADHKHALKPRTHGKIPPTQASCPATFSTSFIGMRPLA